MSVRCFACAPAAAALPFFYTGKTTPLALPGPRPLQVCLPWRQLLQGRQAVDQVDRQVSWMTQLPGSAAWGRAWQQQRQSARPRHLATPKVLRCAPSQRVMNPSSALPCRDWYDEQGYYDEYTD